MIAKPRRENEAILEYNFTKKSEKLTAHRRHRTPMASCFHCSLTRTLHRSLGLRAHLRWWTHQQLPVMDLYITDQPNNDQTLPVCANPGIRWSKKFIQTARLLPAKRFSWRRWTLRKRKPVRKSVKIWQVSRQIPRSPLLRKMSFTIQLR